ncbi:ABC transporter permease subunit [Leifsonia soli]|uniref:Multiple sugar transport system permease protein n=1 Tax=Leifsonia soli TaxID=582665 RepID=A0A852T2G5_9MICO|nr:multiple sugar transport system permease protein [Leifsonia soli]
MTQAAPALVGRTTRSGPRGLHWRSRLTPYLFLAPALLAVGVFVVYPIVNVAIQSFFDVNPTKHEGWEFIGFENYVRAFTDSAVWGVFANSIAWTVGSVALQLVVAMAGALLLQQLAGARVLRAVFVLPWATPVVVGALAWKLLYQPDYGMINQILGVLGLRGLEHAWLADPGTALGAVIAANVWRGFPFIMVLLIAGMASIPAEIYEAAGVDGASWARSFWSLTLPLLKPMLLTSTLMALIWTFNNFSLIYVMTGGGPAGATDILTTFVYKNAFSSFDFGYASALSMILFAIVALGSALYIRAFGKDALA